MKKEKHHSLTLATENGELVVEWVEKSVKNFNLRVRADGSLYASAPRGTRESEMERFLRRNLDFVARARQRLASRPPAAPAFSAVTGATLPILGASHTIVVGKAAKNGVKMADGCIFIGVTRPEDEALCRRTLLSFLAREAAVYLGELTSSLWPQFYPFPAAAPTLRFRNMRTRWGICRPQRGEITFNTRLLLLPRELAVYVVCHELAHFRHPDHSPAFFAHLARYLPEWKAHRKALKSFATPEI